MNQFTQPAPVLVKSLGTANRSFSGLCDEARVSNILPEQKSAGTLAAGWDHLAIAAHIPGVDVRGNGSSSIRGEAMTLLMDRVALDNTELLRAVEADAVECLAGSSPASPTISLLAGPNDQTRNCRESANASNILPRTNAPGSIYEVTNNTRSVRRRSSLGINVTQPAGTI